MTYQENTFSEAENVGSLDRLNRLIAGTTGIVAAVLFTAIPSSAAAGMVAFGIYAGLTAFIGWDPLYALAKAVQRQTPVQTPPTITHYRRREEQTTGGSYKKAA